jgi:hypothetical protein
MASVGGRIAISIVIEHASESLRTHAKNLQARAPPGAGEAYFDVVGFARDHVSQSCVNFVRDVDLDCDFVDSAELDPVGVIPGAVRKARNMKH